MSNNFLPPDPLKDPSQLWRNILGAASIGVGLLVLGATYIKPLSFSTPFTSQVISALSLPTIVSGKKGGDAEIAPPKIEPPALPVLIVSSTISGDRFTAAGMIVKDHTTGMVLFRKNEYTPRPIASITKLMSALVILEKQPRWASSTQVVPDDLEDTHMYAGDTYALKDLWDSALVGSSNKAIMTLADAVGWPRVAFVERMNQKAIELGMTGTRFTDPTGLDEGNVSTPSDVAILLSEALKQPDIQAAVLKKEHTIYSNERDKTEHMWNTNWLLLGWIPQSFADFRGGKTGFIEASGYNFAMQAGGSVAHLLDVVVLGANVHEARFTEARDIAEWVEKSYRWPDMASTTAQ